MQINAKPVKKLSFICKNITAEITHQNDIFSNVFLLADVKEEYTYVLKSRLSD